MRSLAYSLVGIAQSVVCEPLALEKGRGIPALLGQNQIAGALICHVTETSALRSQIVSD
jgi:hypothetical protein